MTRPLQMRRFTLTGAALAALLSLALLPKPAAADKSAGDDATRAREIVQLLQQGQLKIADAITLAEKHAKGPAIHVTCSVRAGATRAEPPETRGARSEAPQPKPSDDKLDGSRLIYEVRCVAGDKIQAVMIDGLTRQVVDGEVKAPPPQK